MKSFTLEAGSVIHIHGLPFYLVRDTTFEGHPANVDAVAIPDPDGGFPFLINFDAMRRPLWKRLLGIR